MCHWGSKKYNSVVPCIMYLSFPSLQICVGVQYWFSQQSEDRQWLHRRSRYSGDPCELLMLHDMLTMDLLPE